MKFRLLIALATAATATAALSPSSAQAACPDVRIDLPATIAIDRPYKEIKVPLTQSCGANYAASDLYGPNGFEDIFIYDPAFDGATDYFDVYDFGLTPATYYLRDGHAYDADYNEYAVTDDSTVVKYGSYLGMSTSRSGSTVKINVSARRYSPNDGRMVANPGQTVGIRHRVPGSPTWTVKTYVKTNSAGNASISFSAPSTRYYQAWFGSSSTVWGSTSASSAR